MPDRLVLACWLPRLGATLGACVAVYCAVELVDLSNLPGAPPLSRYPFRVPLAFVLVAPVVVLLSSCWAGAHLRRTGQIVGLAAAGADPRRALAAIPLWGLAVGLATFVLADHASPRALAEWSGPTTEEAVGPRWSLAGDVIYRLGRQDGSGYRDVVAFVLDSEGRPLRRIDAERARLDARGRWLLVGALTSAPREAPARAPATLEAPAPIPAEVLERSPQHLAGAELRRAAVVGANTGADVASVKAEAGLRLALALLCPLCAALGAIAGSRFGGHAGMATAIAAAVALVAWLAIATSWGLALGGHISWVAIPLAPAALLGPAAAVSWVSVLRA